MSAYDIMRRSLKQTLEGITQAGTYKTEYILQSAQGAEINLPAQERMLNFCANNYLGLSNQESIVAAAKGALTTWGFGLSSVRFICGTQDIHKKLEEVISQFLGTEDTLLYLSAYDANGGLFEPLLGEQDAILSDALNHASIIDGIRLCKAARYRYAHNNMEDLEEKLKESKDARYRLIATDGVFSMDGTIANLNGICALAKKYQALVMVDDCHAMGILGKSGRGTHEHHHAPVDLITGTLGKAMGGGCGGFTSGPHEIIRLLRQRSRPYLFSNSLPPAVAGGAIEALQWVKKDDKARKKLFENTRYFRQGLQRIGLSVPAGAHPIIPIFVQNEVLAKKLSERLFAQGIFVISFTYPVVPKNKPRIRVQISAAHTKEHMDEALHAFEKEALALGLI